MGFFSHLKGPHNSNSIGSGPILQTCLFLLAFCSTDFLDPTKNHQIHPPKKFTNITWKYSLKNKRNIDPNHQFWASKS